MEKIVIEERQSKAMRIAMIGFLCLISSVAVWIFGLKENRIIVRSIGFLATGFCGIRFLILLSLTFQRKPLLTITFDGIIDSSSTSSVGYIAFQDIERFYIVNLSGKDVIGVIPKDEEAFVDKLSPIKQGIARSNISTKLPPFTIRADKAKDMSLEDVFTLLKKRLEDYSCLYD